MCCQGHKLFQSPAVTYTPFTPGGTIGGTVKPGWEKVKDAFANNFAAGREKGAQLVIKLEGETVVDLWGSSACCTTTKGPYDTCSSMSIERDNGGTNSATCNDKKRKKQKDKKEKNQMKKCRYNDNGDGGAALGRQQP